jgi:hypothetical protein
MSAAAGMVVTEMKTPMRAPARAVLCGPGCRFAERRIHLFDGDRAIVVEREGLQLPEYGVGGLGPHVELHSIAVWPPGRSRQYHQI